MKSHRILSAALLLCTLAACGQNPTGSAPQAQSAGASYDGGGFGIGSNSSADESGGYTIGSGGTEGTGGFGIGSGYTGEETEEETTERTGGFGIGSGL